MDRSAERARAGDDPSLDPRYDPIYQRGYASGLGGEQRPAARAASRAERSPVDRVPDGTPRSPERTGMPSPRSSDSPAPEPVAIHRTRPLSTDAGQEDDAMDGLLHPSDLSEDAGPPHHRRWAVLLAVAGLILIVVGAWAYMAAWPLQFQGWSVVNDQVRTPDGLTILQVQFSQLAMAVSPQLIVLGVTAILADLAILTYGAARARR